MVWLHQGEGESLGLFGGIREPFQVHQHPTPNPSKSPTDPTRPPITQASPSQLFLPRFTLAQAPSTYLISKLDWGFIFKLI